jgi:transposase InsO family protein
VKQRRRRRRYAHPGVVPLVTTAPNDLWTTDFKGHFRTRDRLCHGLRSTKGDGVRPVFDRLFREYGSPRAIRTDNGVPFATAGLHGLSQLNVWWLRLGIQHQRILPAHPQQNGAHERMHNDDDVEGRLYRADQSARLKIELRCLAVPDFGACGASCVASGHAGPLEGALTPECGK